MSSRGPFVFGPFKGLINTVTPDAMGPGDLQIGNNGDLDDAQHFRRRAGWVNRQGTASRSLWSDNESCLVLQGTSLKRVNADYSLTTLATVGANDRLCAAQAPGRLYWSTESTTGVIVDGVNRSWGVAAPNFYASQITGNMPRGDYRIAVTVLNAGQESGARAGMRVNAAGGIRVFLPAGDKHIYCTGPDGVDYFFAGSTSELTFDIHGIPAGAPLLTQFMTPPPPSQAIAFWKGRMLMLSGNVLWYTPAYRLEVVRRDRGFVPMPSRGVILAPVEGGVFVATQDKHYFLGGADPQKWNLTPVADYGAIEGTLAIKYSNAGENGAETGLPTPVWTSHRGIVMGTPDGRLLNVTESRYRFGPAVMGSAVIRSHRGYRQYVSVLNQATLAQDAA